MVENHGLELDEKMCSKSSKDQKESSLSKKIKKAFII